MPYMIRDAEEARECVKAAIEWLMDEDGYTAADIRDNLVEPLLEVLEEAAES